MRRILYALVGLSLLGAPALAQNNSFTSFITNAPAATTPLGVGDLIPVIQGGETRSFVGTGGGIGMFTNAANVSLPTALNNFGLGTANVPQFSGLNLQTAAPPTLSAFGTGHTAQLILSTTGSTPTAGSSDPLYGIVAAAQQLVTSTGGNASYVGAALTASGRASGGEGGFATTLANPASASATTLDLTSTAGFVDGLLFTITLDSGLVQNLTQVGAPSGSTITVTPALSSDAAAGNAVYRYYGQLKGAITQSTAATGSVGFNMVSIEASMSAQTGSTPYLKSILGATANSDDTVGALSPYDSGLFLSRQIGAIGYKVGISFDPRSGNNLVGTTGTLIKSFGGAYADGVNLVSSSFTGNAFASDGFAVDGTGIITLAKSAPSIRYNNTGGTVTTGGLWRTIVSGGQFILQNNTAVAGDFSTVGSPFLVDYTGYARISAASANMRYNDTLGTVTTGGLWRTIVSGGLMSFQANTAAGGDFSAAIIPLQVNYSGDVFAAQSAAIATNAVDKFLYVPTMAGKPAGTPTNAAAGRTAVAVNTTDHQLCWYEQPGTAWYCVVGTTPP